MNKLFYSIIMLTGVLISAFAQVLLKKSANRSHNTFVAQYVNWRVVSAYSIFVVATFCSIIAYRAIPLSLGPVLASTEYLFVAGLDRMFFSKQISKLTMAGLFVIIAGIVIFAT